ncbi:MAG: nitrate reductase associated protein [Chitinophagaceae bacterium]
MKDIIPSSLFKSLKNVEYFEFEEDFVEENMRCIPMIVRFKMDLAGIKLKLAHWCKFSNDERITLALMPCKKQEEVSIYRQFLAGLIKKYANEEPEKLAIVSQPEWAIENAIPEQLLEKAGELKCDITLVKWAGLTELQRFALLKLLRPGHENKHFPKAIHEFNLASGVSH